jgi:hypothetical protein
VKTPTLITMTQKELLVERFSALLGFEDMELLMCSNIFCPSNQATYVGKTFLSIRREGSSHIVTTDFFRRT